MIFGSMPAMKYQIKLHIYKSRNSKKTSGLRESRKSKKLLLKYERIPFFRKYLSLFIFNIVDTWKIDK